MYFYLSMVFRYSLLFCLYVIGATTQRMFPNTHTTLKTFVHSLFMTFREVTVRPSRELEHTPASPLTWYHSSTTLIGPDNPKTHSTHRSNILYRRMWIQLINVHHFLQLSLLFLFSVQSYSKANVVFKLNCLDKWSYLLINLRWLRLIFLRQWPRLCVKILNKNMEKQ